MPQARVVPDGLTYAEDFLSEQEERTALELVGALEFEPVVLHGTAARRTVRHFGWTYRFGTFDLVAGEPLPPELDGLRARSEALAGVPAGAFEQALVTRYPPGATIGWHRDAPPFGPVIAGVSLLAPCRMRFRRDLDGVRYVHDQTLAPRSAYVLAGSARSAWQHHIPPTSELRYSITFRTVLEAARRRALSAPRA